MAKDWGYTSTNGPDVWSKTYPIGNGPRQSPIDIVSDQALYDSSLQTSSPLTCNYQAEKNMVIKNNGHSIQAVIKEKSYLEGGALKSKYQLAQFHLHWGATPFVGSEHKVDGKTYAAELHLVHFNVEKYKTIENALNQPDGLAVLGIFITQGEGNNGFKAISDKLGGLTEVGSEITLDEPFDPICLLPGNTRQYWTYLGSLTTPPLLESVIWTVFKDTVKYSEEQMQKLRSLRCSDNTCMTDNFRPPLPLGGRPLSKSFQ